MVSETPDPVEEHRRLSRAGSKRSSTGSMCCSPFWKSRSANAHDYPEGLFDEYDEALHQASQANRAYFLWLAEQGLRSR